MPAYTFRALSGVAGEVTRPDKSTVETGIINTAAAPQAYGAPVVINSTTGLVQAWTSSDTSSTFGGILVREAPSIAGSTGQALNSAVPNPNMPCGVMTEGYMNVVCVTGTPVKGQPVNICITAGSGLAVGDFSTTTNASNLAISRLTWAANGKDANNVAEVRFL